MAVANDAATILQLGYRDESANASARLSDRHTDHGNSSWQIYQAHDGSRTTTGALPDDYRTRHPIVVGEQERTIDIPIATGATRLTRGQSEVIAGFADVEEPPTASNWCMLA